MRIVSGQFGGRRLNVPSGRDIRPTSDKVRGAIFNALRSRGVVDGARVIDCFAGTGALGLEAISQGAEYCLFLDYHRSSLDLARENAQALGLADEVTFLKQDSSRLKERDYDIPTFDLVFLDPPYGQNLLIATLEALDQGDWLSTDAFCVVEVEKAYQGVMPQSYNVLDERLYGDTKILFLGYQNAPE